jgi:hypothetical protein
MHGSAEIGRCGERCGVSGQCSSPLKFERSSYAHGKVNGNPPKLHLMELLVRVEQMPQE